MTSHGSLRTPVCELLAIRYPIIQAGMAGATTPDLVAAVSNAGGLGVLGAARLKPDQLRQAIREVRILTTRPFGVNLLLAPPEPDHHHDAKAVQTALNRVRRELSLPARFEEVALPPSLSPNKCAWCSMNGFRSSASGSETHDDGSRRPMRPERG